MTCDECGDRYTQCTCERLEQLHVEHGDMLALLEAVESRLETGLPVAHDDELRCRIRRALAGAYRQD